MTPGDPPQTQAALEALCQACGLCCDGALFTHVTLSGDEPARLAGQVEVKQRPDGTVALAQPCRALAQRCCTVYAQRPRGCRNYVCSLFMALEGGEARPDEALGIVAHAHHLIARLEAELPEVASPESTLPRARRSLRPPAGPVRSAAAREALRDAENHLRFHFGWKG